ncbi:hypothetical protein, partial [Streptomyces rubellomurinus]|uniref:hypothetical protein n=1 Tax=Streptomyces rubellomurinus (strain ATCC 31215) TaxID=359131 RepID=UPI0012FF57EA
MSVSRATAPEADELLIDARMSPATKKKPKVRLVRPVYRGGPYSTLGVKNPRGGKNRATKGTERNHMPAWKATKDAQAVGGRTAKITQALNVVSRYTAPRRRDGHRRPQEDRKLGYGWQGLASGPDEAAGAGQ